MDIKIHGLTRPIIEEAIRRTKEAREYIINEVLTPAIAEPRKEVGKYAPKIKQIMIDPQKIGDVVGSKGKVINQIIDETGVKIDITDDGAVAVCGVEKEGIDKAIEMIQMIASEFEEGKIYVGKVEMCIRDRAGAGVNNIPLDKCAEKGIVVFDTPGANANGVKELVLAGLFMATRNVVAGANWVAENKADENISKTMEKAKKAFAGTEILGKKIGVIGLGAIGAMVANACDALGMRCV